MFSKFKRSHDQILPPDFYDIKKKKNELINLLFLGNKNNCHFSKIRTFVSRPKLVVSFVITFMQLIYCLSGIIMLRN